MFGKERSKAWNEVQKRIKAEKRVLRMHERLRRRAFRVAKRLANFDELAAIKKAVKEFILKNGKHVYTFARVDYFSNRITLYISTSRFDARCDRFGARHVSTLVVDDGVVDINEVLLVFNEISTKEIGITFPHASDGLIHVYDVADCSVRRL